MEAFKKYSLVINKFLQKELRQRQAVLKNTFPFWGKDLIKRLVGFVPHGKMIRGGLVLLACQMSKKRLSRDSVAAAAAIELLHSALLVHDDIMDQSRWRRGKASMYHQYALLAKKNSIRQPEHFGYSAGLCVGDILFFLAFDVLSDLPVSGSIKQKIISFYAQEMMKVGLAQVKEMYVGGKDTSIPRKEIMEIYRYKTARYTFSLPLVIGGMLSKMSKQKISKLEKLGETLGILFQIKDDELGLFGSQSSVGKSIGTDIEENKKTLYHYYLFTKANRQQKARLQKIFNHSHITTRQLQYVRETIIGLNIATIVKKEMDKLLQSSLRQIRNLSVSKHYQALLVQLTYYIIQRQR